MYDKVIKYIESGKCFCENLKEEKEFRNAIKILQHENNIEKLLILNDRIIKDLYSWYKKEKLIKPNSNTP